MSFIEQDYVPVPPQWIERRVLWLLKTLPKRDPGFLKRQPSRFLDPVEVYAPLSKGDVAWALVPICGKYGIDRKRISWAYADRLSSHDAGAQVLAEPGGPIAIEILRAYKEDAVISGGFLAHEVAHAYLTDLGIVNGGTWMAEATTDLTTLVCGLGKLTVNMVRLPWAGMFSADRAGTPSGGYLNREALICAYAIAADELGVTDAEQEKDLATDALSYLRALRA